MTSDLDQLKAKILEFRKVRDWEKYHTPRNLATALAVEASEILEVFQWKLDSKITPQDKAALEDELADVLNYLILLANSLDIDLIKVANQKMVKNAQKYPIEKSLGKAPRRQTISKI